MSAFGAIRRIKSPLPAIDFSRADGIARRLLRASVGPLVAVVAASLLLVIVGRESGRSVRAELSAAASRTLAAAEAPIAAATEALSGLERAGSVGCTAPALAAFRAAMGGPLRNIGVADDDGFLVCAGGPVASPPGRVLPHISPRMPTVTIETDPRPDRRRVFIAWATRGGPRLVAELDANVPILAEGPSYAEGRLAVAVALGGERLWRATAPAPSELPPDAARREVASSIFPITVQVALPGEIVPPGFAGVRRATLTLVVFAGAILGWLGWRVSGVRIGAPKPQASAIRPFYWPVYQIDSRRLIGLDLVIAAPDGAELPASEAAAALDGRLLDRVLTEMSPTLRRAPDLRLSFPLDLTGESAAWIIGELPTTIARLGIDPDALVVRVAVEATADPAAVARIETLRAMNLAVAADGAGPGRYLVLSDPLPDFLFVDGRLASDLTTSETALLIMEAAVSLARRLDLGVIARGIESEDALAVLESIGVTSGAGPVFGRPLAARAAADLASELAAEAAAAQEGRRRAA